MSLALAVLIALASPAQSWTFCVAESGAEIWITDVFAAAQERERLEADFRAELSAHGVAHPVAQCPLPRDDRIEVVNAQFTAAEFHRKLGQTLHAAAPPSLKR